jgi:DNA-binding transcriptional MerR regulator
MSYSVGQVATFAKVTVRTLHHYDEIGLLSPSGRTSAGYRRYADHDLERLQQILTYRELGFPLEEVAGILDDPESDPGDHLRRQHALLRRRIGRLEGMVAAVERMMEAQQMGISLTPEERFEVFGDIDEAEWAARAEEAEQRWGDSDAWRQSQQRTRAYGKDDWVRIKGEADDITRRLAESLADGAPADGERAMGLAEEHRGHISRWFYDCGYPIHRGLGDMYVTDPRFTSQYEAVRDGLAQYIRDAVAANASRHGA